MKTTMVLSGIAALTMATAGIGYARVDADTTWAPERWNVDVPHTQVTFTTSHFFTPVRGSFEGYQVDLFYDDEDPANSSVEVRIDVTSIDTGNEKRDNHLRSPDWFEAETYPEIVFRSTSVRQVAEDQLLARGELTMKGTTREIELPIRVLGAQELPPPMQEAMGVSEIAAFQAGTTIDRREWGIGVGSWAQTLVVGADVDISVTLEANR